MFATLLDLLFPRRSLTGSEGAWITEEELCLLVAAPVIEERGVLRRRGLHSLDRLVAASTYRRCPLLKKAIHTFKYRRIPALAGALAGLLPHDLPSDVVLCPVPLHWTRRFARGFNQSALLAAELGRERGCTVCDLLTRVRATGSQAKRHRVERLTALEHAFRCIVSDPPVSVVLVDDLSTTGATLDECARALKTAGVQHVEGWVIAHDQ
ncbi:MAG: hypothetical protein PHS73_03345 [Candidatus Peribacteraceae bacterium]|nr:hypothetical protein [Candidatus Peribacteraceae bacterium]